MKSMIVTIPAAREADARTQVAGLNVQIARTSDQQMIVEFFVDPNTGQLAAGEAAAYANLAGAGDTGSVFTGSDSEG